MTMLQIWGKARGKVSIWSKGMEVIEQSHGREVDKDADCALAGKP